MATYTHLHAGRTRPLMALIRTAVATLQPLAAHAPAAELVVAAAPLEHCLAAVAAGIYYQRAAFAKCIAGVAWTSVT